VGAVERLARGDLVPFGDHVLHGEVGVGEGSLNMAVTILIPSQSAGTPGGALWLTNSGEQISSIRLMLPGLARDRDDPLGV
jgi:hypothetical protein